MVSRKPRCTEIRTQGSRTKDRCPNPIPIHFKYGPVYDTFHWNGRARKVGRLRSRCVKPSHRVPGKRAGAARPLCTRTTSSQWSIMTGCSTRAIIPIFRVHTTRSVHTVLLLGVHVFTKCSSGIVLTTISQSMFVWGSCPGH